MKISLRIVLASLAITCVVYTGCKKSDLQPVNQSTKNQGDQKAMASKIAADFFKSFSPSGKSNKKTNGLGIMSVPQCGDFTITPFNQDFMRGDTSVTARGKSIFTYTCSGTNTTGPDGYNFADTLYTTESGKGFINTFENFQKYNVVSIPNANAYKVNAGIVAFARYAYVGDKGMTEHHDFSTTYELNGNGGVAQNDNPATLVGIIDFRCSHTHIYENSPEKNEHIRYAGFMDVKKDVISSYFFAEGETYYWKYDLDPVTKAIISGPTKAYYNRK